MSRDVLDIEKQILSGASPVASYQRDGYVIVRGIIPESILTKLRADIAHLIKYKWRSVFGESKSIPVDSDLALIELDLIDSRHGVEIVAAAWRLHSFLTITTHPILREYAANFLRSEDLLLSACSMRYDRPFGDEHLIPWHQDYPFIQDSENSCVIWFPINDLAPECGGVRIIPRSHEKGIRPVRNKAGWLELAEPIEHHPQDSKFPNLKSGDVLFMNTMTIHRSEENRGSKIRWTGQCRIGDFSNTQTIDRGWPRGMVQGQTFEERHAEYLVE